MRPLESGLRDRRRSADPSGIGDRYLAIPPKGRLGKDPRHGSRHLASVKPKTARGFLNRSTWGRLGKSRTHGPPESTPGVNEFRQDDVRKPARRDRKGRRDSLPSREIRAISSPVNVARYFGLVVLTLSSLATARGADDQATDSVQPASGQADVEQIVQSSPGQIVPLLPGQAVQALPGQMVHSLPGQMVPLLPGQVAQALPGQVVHALPVQMVQLLPGQAAPPLPNKSRARSSKR